MTPAYRIGDRVVYPARGVAEIGEIVEKEIAGTVEIFYVLTLLDGASTILVPVQRAAELGIRGIIGHQEVARIFELLRMHGKPAERESWSRRQRAFLQKIHSNNVFDVAEVFRELSDLGRYKALSFSERRLLETTRRLLVGELAIAKGIPREQMERQVDRLVSGKSNRKD